MGCEIGEKGCPPKNNTLFQLKIVKRDASAAHSIRKNWHYCLIVPSLDRRIRRPPAQGVIRREKSEESIWDDAQYSQEEESKARSTDQSG
jgi:hypothetical protein